jgi:hypothetical protein
VDCFIEIGWEIFLVPAKPIFFTCNVKGASHRGTFPAISPNLRKPDMLRLRKSSGGNVH